MDEYDPIFDQQLILAEATKKFYEGTGPEPLYGDYSDKLDYGIYDKDLWFISYGTSSFADPDKATISQSHLRRECFDELLCMDRTFLLHTYSRQDFYDIEADRVDQEISRISKNKANHLKRREAYSKYVVKIT